MKARRIAQLLIPALTLVLMSIPGFSASAADGKPASERDGAIWMAVSDKRLDVLRGGFDAGGGLLVSLGITRAVYINGALITQTTLNFGRVTDLTTAQAAQLNRQLATLNLVQNGPGNFVQPGAANGATGGTIIQNTLNNQQIVNQTVINASSNAMGMMRNLNLQNTLADTLSRAAAPR